MDRLLILAEGVRGSLHTGWPGTGASDPRATQIADTLTRAARLVGRYAGEIRAERAAVRQDLDAARTRIMHGLYLTGHAVVVALHQYGRDRHRDASDPRATQIADTLTRAARLVGRYAGEIRAERAAVRQDLDAARTRIMHGLYVTGHAVGVALHQHGRDRHRDASATGRPLPLSTRRSPYAIGPTGQWIQRLAVCERAAGRYFDRGFAHALAGEVTRPLDDPGRLQRALTAWDIQAHRTLASAPSPTNVLLVTRTQGLIAGAGLVLVDAAARAGILPGPETAQRLAPAINQAGAAWSNLSSRWSDLKTPLARVDGDLMRAAAEVRAASRELTHDKTIMASMEEISTRPCLAQAATAILRALEASAELAYIVSEQADDPNLAGPARALSLRAHNDIEAGLAPRHDPAEDIVWVSPADILAKRTIPIPAPVAETLRASSVVVVDAAESAAAAASVAGGDGSARTHGGESGAAESRLPRRQPVGRSASEHATPIRHSR